MEKYFWAELEVSKDFEERYGSEFEERIFRDLAHEIVNKIPLKHLKDIFNFSNPVEDHPYKKRFLAHIPLHPLGMISVKKELPLLNKQVIVWHRGKAQIGSLILINNELAWAVGWEIPFFDLQMVSALSIEFWKHI